MESTGSGIGTFPLMNSSVTGMVKLFMPLMKLILAGAGRITV